MKQLRSPYAYIKHHHKEITTNKIMHEISKYLLAHPNKSSKYELIKKFKSSNQVPMNTYNITIKLA